MFTTETEGASKLSTKDLEKYVVCVQCTAIIYQYIGFVPRSTTLDCASLLLRSFVLNCSHQQQDLVRSRIRRLDLTSATEICITVL